MKLIYSVLKPKELAFVRGISKHLHKISDRDELWRNVCFDSSADEARRIQSRGTTFQPNLPFQAHPQIQEFRRRTETALSAQHIWVSTNATTAGTENIETRSREISDRDQAGDFNTRERVRRLANWDPTYRTERVNWYTEYIARHGPLSCSWFQPAVVSNDGSTVEPRGLALLGTRNIIAPLEDDSLAIWSTGHEDNEKQGRLIHKTQPGLLQTEKTSINPTMTSAISVDNDGCKAYVVVQNYLQEVDLETNQISNSQRFPSKIAALSDFTNGLPLTVGTRSAVHLYDPRDRLREHNVGAEEYLDTMSTYPDIELNGSSLSHFKTGNFDRFASLHQAGPTAVQHLFKDDSGSTSSDIVISGRFPSLLIYDRRTFPNVKTTLYSGAQLCGLAALPYAYSSVDSEIMRRGELPMHAANEARNRPGHTILACGEYKGRGSLEIYGLSDEEGSYIQASTFKNRVSAARAKVLSIANHGPKLVISDAEGGIRWIERDGQTLVRRWNINKFEWHGDRMINMTGGSSDGQAILKLLPASHSHTDKAFEDGIYVWTGERVGLLTFSSVPKFGGNDNAEWEKTPANAEEAIKRREEKVYGETMRRALEMQADEVRWMSGLGLRG